MDVMDLQKVRPPDPTFRGLKSKWGSSDSLGRNGMKGIMSPVIWLDMLGLAMGLC